MSREFCADSKINLLINDLTLNIEDVSEAAMRIGPDLALHLMSSTHAMEAKMENDEGHPLNGPFPTD